jgi:hypothetical protein
MKIGFIVEGDGDRAAVESVARKLLPGVRIHTVRLGGKAALPTAYTSVIELLRKGYDHVFIVFDADTTDGKVAAAQRRTVEASLREHKLDERTTVVAATPTVEEWLTSRNGHDRGVAAFEAALTSLTGAK